MDLKIPIVKELKLFLRSDTQPPPTRAGLGRSAVIGCSGALRAQPLEQRLLAGTRRPGRSPPLRAVLSGPLFMSDEGILLHGADLLLQGKKLYADFFQFLPPGVVVLTAAWFKVAGVSFGSARLLALANHGRGRVFHFPGLPAGIAQRAALRLPRDRLGNDVGVSVDADQPSLVRDAPVDGRPPGPRLPASISRSGSCDGR